MSDELHTLNNAVGFASWSLAGYLYYRLGEPRRNKLADHFESRWKVMKRYCKIGYIICALLIPLRIALIFLFPPDGGDGGKTENIIVAAAMSVVGLLLLQGADRGSDFRTRVFLLYARFAILIDFVVWVKYVSSWT